MSGFLREERYIVIKRKTLLSDAEEMLWEYLGRNRIPTVEGVVVESDWPEYEKVWRMIEDRVTGQPAGGDVGERELISVAFAREGLTASVGEAARLIRGGGAYIDHVRVEKDGPMPSGVNVISAGKRKFVNIGAFPPKQHPTPEQAPSIDEVPTASERAVTVCPQCEGEGGYPDGLDEAACHTDCTRCGGNGWIVDLAALNARPADAEGEG